MHPNCMRYPEGAGWLYKVQSSHTGDERKLFYFSDTTRRWPTKILKEWYVHAQEVTGTIAFHEDHCEVRLKWKTLSCHLRHQSIIHAEVGCYVVRET